MFKPKYHISSELLANIKKISTVVTQLNARTYPHVILQKYEKLAKDLSTHASTSIEGNPLPLTDVKALLKSRPEHIRDTEREVLNYNNALIWLERELNTSSPMPITHDVIHNIHALIMDNLMTEAHLQDYRNEPVFVNDPREHKTIYWPPDQQDVNKLMSELIEFIHHSKNDIDPLLVSGIFHKQFVIIHPYIDGNGRTVRLVTKALLASMGLNTFNLFSFENYYNNNVTSYFTYVGERGNYYDIVDRVDFTPWLVYFTGGIIDELLRVSKKLEKEIITPQNILTLDENKMLAYIDMNGFITDKIYSTLTKRAKSTRNLDFQKLISMRIIRTEGKGKATYYKKV